MKQYKQITKVEALQLLIDNNGNAVGGMAFRDNCNCTWRWSKLVQVNCDPNTRLIFCTPNAVYEQCAIVEEVADPFEKWWGAGYGISTDKEKTHYQVCKEAYELGQQNPLDENDRKTECAGS